MAKSKTRRKSTSRRIFGVVVILVIAGAGVGIGISAASASGGSQFTTSAATISTVSHTLAVAGDLEPIDQATAEFQVAGTVSAVDVSVGDKVAAGQVIATLDKTPLEAALTEADATLAAAKATLTENEEDESATSGDESETEPSTTSETSSKGTDIDLTSATSDPDATELSQDQAAIVADQHTVDMDMQTVAADLTTISTACSTSDSSGTGGSTGTDSSANTSSSSTTTTTSPTTTTMTTPGSGSSTACSQALSTADVAEQQVTQDQETLATAESTLATLLSSMASSSSGAEGSGSTSKSGPSTSTTTPTKESSGNASTNKDSSSSKTSNGSSSNSGSSTSTDTPQQLATDESAIDSDEAGVVEAEQSLADAELTSPIAGAVENVEITTGGTVSAGSSTDEISVVDWDSYEVTGSLTTTEVSEVKVGQETQVSVDGVSGTFEGKVTEVGPAQESDSTYTYPVLIAITSAITGSMPAGASAEVTVELAQAANVLVVPTSAVHTTTAGDSYVYLAENGAEVRQTVKVGLVGDIYTQITSGLHSGQVVVLANSSISVPSSSTDSNNFSFGGVGGSGRTATFGGGGTFGGSAAPPG